MQGQAQETLRRDPHHPCLSWRTSALGEKAVGSCPRPAASATHAGGGQGVHYNLVLTLDPGAETPDPVQGVGASVWAALPQPDSPGAPLKATEGPQQGQVGEHRACGHSAEWAARATRTASPLAQGLSSPTASRHIVSIPKLQKVLVPECGVRGLLSEGPECGQSPIAILPRWGQGGWTGTCPLSVHRGSLSQAPAARAPRTFLGSPTAGACGDGWVWCRWTEARVEEPAGYEVPWVGLGAG